MRVQCVLVATTLLHSGAKFHSFINTGSKTVHVNKESCCGGMSTRLKQRAVTEFLSAENVTPAKIHRRLQAVYGENTVNRTTVNCWAIKFHECEPSLANIVDQPCSGRLVSVTDDRHQKQVDELIQHDRRITQKQIAGRLGMSKERVGYIIGLLGYTKVCSRWVPRMLTPEKKQKCVEICEELLKRYREEGDQFLLNIVTGDESWIHHFDPEEKRLSVQYRHTSSPCPKKIQNSAVCRQDSLTVFWDSQRVYMTEFLEAGKTVNSARYIETIKNLRRRVCRVRRSTSPILLLHDNARPHTVRSMIDALEMLKFEVLSHPPYNPDLAPSNFHFFPHLKRDLKETHFTSYDEVKQAVTSWIKERTPEFFIDSMRKLVLRWKKCIE
jgi:transposase